MISAVLDSIVVPKLVGGPARRTPDRVLADKAYSSAANRKLLRSKRIVVVIPQRSDQVANRKRRGRDGGRPPGFDSDAYQGRNVVERAFDNAKPGLFSDAPGAQIGAAADATRSQASAIAFTSNPAPVQRR